MDCISEFTKLRTKIYSVKIGDYEGETNTLCILLQFHLIKTDMSSQFPNLCG